MSAKGDFDKACELITVHRAIAPRNGSTRQSPTGQALNSKEILTTTIAIFRKLGIWKTIHSGAYARPAIYSRPPNSSFRDTARRSQ